jgi:tight adherence protein C
MNIESLLPFGVSMADVIAAMASVTAFGTVCVVWTALLARDTVGVRAKRLRQRREQLKAGLMAPRRNLHRKASAIGAMRNVTLRFNLLRSKAADKIAERLAQAGMRSKDAVVTFLFLKISLPFLFGGGGFLLFNVLEVGHLSPPMPQLIPLGAVVLGAYLPDIFVKNAAAKRQKLIQKSLPDALDLLVICAEAGLALDAALTRVAGEMEKGGPEMADEVGLTAVELGFLPNRRQALDNLTRRCPLPSMRGVVNTLIQTEKYGTPLANSLRVLAAEFRNDRMMKAEEKAARLPAIMTVPMILFILPPLMIVLIGPAMIKVFDAIILMNR